MPELLVTDDTALLLEVVLLLELPVEAAPVPPAPPLPVVVLITHPTVA